MQQTIIKLSLLITLAFGFIASSSQTPKDFISLGNFVPPSPEAAALARYGQIPVSLSTGIPSIEIPVYEVKSRKLALPISLSYHASGIKVEDIATFAGLGWSLNAGGAISRNVVGVADEKAAGFRNLTVYKDRSQLENVSFSTSDYTNYDYLTNLSSGAWDAQSDIYDINTPAFTGRFVYDSNKQAQWTPVDKQLNIMWNNSDTTYSIIDDIGVRYVFGVKEHTESGAVNNITAWYLSLMVSADGTDTIRLKYKDAAVSYDVFGSQQYEINWPTTSDGVNCYSGTPSGSFSSSSNTLYYYKKLPDSILFANGYVKFTYANDREDPANERLAGIFIKSGNSVVREISLKHSYFVSDGDPVITIPDRSKKRLKLDSVLFKDASSAVVYRYAFDYDTTIKLPYYYKNYNSSLPVGKTARYDLWGYFNGSTSDYMLPSGYRNYLISFLSLASSSISNTILSDYDSKSYDRYPNPAYTQANMLKGIRYPTGGATHFEYENNKIANNGNHQDYVGGLRIKRVISANGIRDTLSKIYEYGDSAGMGVPITRNLPENFYYPVTTITQGSGSGGYYCYSSNFYVSANPNTAINYYSDAPLIYTKVTERDTAAGTNNGKTEYTFDYEGDSTYGVSYVTKYWNFSTDKSWARGLPLTKKMYKYEGGQYSLIKKVENTYQTMGSKNIKVGYLCEQMTRTTNLSLDNYLSAFNLSSSQYILLGYFDYIDVVLAYGVKKLLKTEETEYSNDSLVSRKDYFYESNYHLYPTKLRSYASGGDTDVQIIKYPQDKAAIAGLRTASANALDSLVTRNILDLPVETEKYKNSTLLYRNRTEYSDSNHTGRYYESFYSQQLGTHAMEQRIHYLSYDPKGNISSVAKVGDITAAYIWDYDRALPIAKCTNADSASIAYTSFESDGRGNWSGINTSYIDSASKAITGKRYYNQTGFSISKSGLSASDYYIVSYWSKGSSDTVSGTQSGYPKTLNSITLGSDTWTLYEHLVTGQTTVTVSGSGGLDELRLFPKDAQMITFTYAPLLGVMSQCDINNRISYYEYDAFGRLAIVRDPHYNILKKICYNYAGQAEDCGLAPVCTSCSGDNKKCINGICETGNKIYLSSTLQRGGSWHCTYVYYWSDCSVSARFTETNGVSCSIGTSECDQ